MCQDIRESFENVSESVQLRRKGFSVSLVDVTMNLGHTGFLCRSSLTICTNYLEVASNFSDLKKA